MRLYDKYREVAFNKGLTDCAVSRLAGVSRQSISEWKTGKYQISLRNRYKIATALGTDMDFNLIKGENNEETSNSSCAC